MKPFRSDLTLCGKPADRVLEEIRKFHSRLVPEKDA